jgi:hypothetical protein
MAWFLADFEASLHAVPPGQLPADSLRLQRDLSLLLQFLRKHALVDEVCPLEKTKNKQRLTCRQERLTTPDDLFRPVLEAFVAVQRSRLQEYLRNIVSTESWRPGDTRGEWYTAANTVSSSRLISGPRHSKAVVDLFTMIFQFVSVYCDAIPHSAAAAHTLQVLLHELLAGYVAVLAEPCLPSVRI